MATMIDGESYVGRVLIRPLSPSGDLRLYLWPLIFPFREFSQDRRGFAPSPS